MVCYVPMLKKHNGAVVWAFCFGESYFQGSSPDFVILHKGWSPVTQPRTTLLLQQPDLCFLKGKKDQSQQPLLPKHAYNI